MGHGPLLLNFSPQKFDALRMLHVIWLISWGHSQHRSSSAMSFRRRQLHLSWRRFLSRQQSAHFVCQKQRALLSEKLVTLSTHVATRCFPKCRCLLATCLVSFLFRTFCRRSSNAEAEDV